MMITSDEHVSRRDCLNYLDTKAKSVVLGIKVSP
jgi:hypothetical protein